ncbi:MAG: class I SAM-dependent methyltransferase [Myxococcota bacterium]
MDREYLLGDDDQELARLQLQHRVWAEVTHASWRRGRFRVGGRILDLGCGPGYCALELAQWVGARGEVIAVDQSSAFLEILKRRAAREGVANIRTVHGRVDELELAAGSLDGAFARWLLCFLPDPRELIMRVSRALRPGATLVTLDYFNYRAFSLAPRSRALGEIVVAIERSFRDSGGDVDVQGQIPGLMNDAGLEVTEIRPVSPLARPGTPYWHWIESFVRGYLPGLIAQGYIDPPLVQAFWHDWTTRSTQPGAYLVPPPVVEIHGVRRAV